MNETIGFPLFLLLPVLVISSMFTVSAIVMGTNSIIELIPMVTIMVGLILGICFYIVNSVKQQ
jgi:hypothetical protein